MFYTRFASRTERWPGLSFSEKEVRTSQLAKGQKRPFPFSGSIFGLIIKSWEKNSGTQAMVEFVNIADAVKAKKNLNGTFIYADCCSLRVDYGKADKLTVRST